MVKPSFGLIAAVGLLAGVAFATDDSPGLRPGSVALYRQFAKDAVPKRLEQLRGELIAIRKDASLSPDEKAKKISEVNAELKAFASAKLNPCTIARPFRPGQVGVLEVKSGYVSQIISPDEMVVELTYRKLNEREALRGRTRLEQDVVFIVLRNVPTENLATMDPITMPDVVHVIGRAEAIGRTCAVMRPFDGRLDIP